jgi:thiamine-monophosphate kinase
MSRPSEDELIATYFAPLAGAGAFGLRDDAAILAQKPGHDIVATKDMLIAGVHFFTDDPPGAVARKALRVNLSDLAAKGAEPSGFLLGLALPEDWTAHWLAGFAQGLGEDAAVYKCPVLGGDTVKSPGPLVVSITAFGTVPAQKMILRAGVAAGDRIYVTETSGDAALGLKFASTKRTLPISPAAPFCRARVLACARRCAPMRTRPLTFRTGSPAILRKCCG